jgi:hypothetical protein
MPDVREVYEMVTRQKPPEPGALERQQKRQIRAARNKKIGAFVVAAAIALAAVVLIQETRSGEDAPPAPATQPTTVAPVDTAAQEVAMSFLKAYGAFNAKQASTYLADNADITDLTQGLTGVEGLSLMTSFLEAQRYQQTITSFETGTLGSDTTVTCGYDFHAIRSDEIGLGPYSGSSFYFTVRDGEIVRASNDIDIEKFSPQMWEPFAEWVSTTYPKDAAVMYNATLTDFRLTEKSIRLWDQHTREYVKEVQQTQGP